MSNIDWELFLSIALISIFAVTLLTCYFFPIYPDEIQVRFWLSRLPYDFPIKISGAPTCVSTFTQPIPATMYVPGLVNWILHGNLESLIALRLVGIIIPILWIAGLAFYLRNKLWIDSVHGERGGVRRIIYLAGLLIAVFLVGVAPFFLVTNRNEQLMLPSVALLLFIFLASQRLEKTGPGWRIWGLTVMYFVAVSLTLYGHAKGLFMTPFFVIVGWQLFRQFSNRVILVALMVLLGLHIFEANTAYKFAFQCNEVPGMEALLKRFSLDPAAIFYDPYTFFNNAFQSLINFKKYLHQLGFQSSTDINYLPTSSLGPFAHIANAFIWLNFVIAFFTILVLLPVSYYRKDASGRRFITINAALLILLVCLIISAVFNIPKNWYDAGYVYAVLLIIWVFFIGENYRGIFQKIVAKKIYIYLGSIAMLSQVVLIHRYLPAFWGGYAGPSISIATYDHSEATNDIATASNACGIDPVRSKKVIVDDYTYLYFHKSSQPMAITYIPYANSNTSALRFILEADSSGLIVRCSSMPHFPFVKRVGKVCCISKSDLNEIKIHSIFSAPAVIK